MRLIKKSSGISLGAGFTQHGPEVSDIRLVESVSESVSCYTEVTTGWGVEFKVEEPEAV